MKMISRKSVCTFLLLAVVAGVGFNCADGEKIVDPYSTYLTWAFTGKVIDGYCGESLPGIIISYVDKKGGTSYEVTDFSGTFSIDGLPAGQRSFTFYQDSADTGTLTYTKKELLISSGIQGTDSLAIPIDVSRIVKLHPLAGILTGNVNRRFFANGQSTPVCSVGVKVDYSGSSDSSGEFLSPSVFIQKTDSAGKFYFTGLPVSDDLRVLLINKLIDGITYTATNFSQPKVVAGEEVSMGKVYMEPLDLQNSMFRFVYSNVYDFVNKNVINGLPVNEKIVMVANKKISSAITMIRYNSSSGTPVLTEQVISEDTLFIVPQVNLITGGRYYLYVSAVADSTGEVAGIGNSSYVIFYAGSDFLPILASNVISESGVGLQQVPVHVSPYFVLLMTPDPATVTVQFSGAGSPKAQVQVSGDTVIAHPVKNFTNNSTVTTRILGVDTSGNKIDIYLNGTKAFRTEYELFCVKTNTHDANGNAVKGFPLNDTMWVKYSKPLDTDIALIEWNNPYTEKKLYGGGVATNSQAWISVDTLFVLPEEQAYLSYGDEVGFRVRVSTPDGLRSASEIFSVFMEDKDVYVTWSNTIDSLGNQREDFGLMENVIVIANEPVKKIDRVSTSSSGALPPGITPSCFTLKTDTIIFNPPIRMIGNTLYGMDFDCTFKNGMKKTNVLGVSWRTVPNVKIVNVNNKSQGKYRVFKVLGDSLSVTFSEKIDTSRQAATRFKAHVLDKNSIAYSTLAKWDVSVKTVTLHILDTLPVADEDANPAYTDQAVNTRAITSVTFDLTSAGGVYANNVGLSNGKIEIHTEPGLCAIGANFIQNHTPGAVVTKYEQAQQYLDPSTNLSVTFNRQLDTLAIKSDISDYYFGLANANGTMYPYSISFSDNGCTAIINPASKLNSNKEYYLRIKNVPAAGIKNARAVNKHSGTYSGSATGNSLLVKSFRVTGPIISHLTTALLADDNTIPLVMGDRFGYSAGFVYDKVVGSSNAGGDNSLILRIQEAAWNSNHSDSVGGYQVQVQKVDKVGNTTPWYFAETTVPTISYSSAKPGINTKSLDITAENFYSLIVSEDLDNEGSFYQNGPSLLNDSTRIKIRVRPYVSDGNSLLGQVGVWSAEAVLADNVAPCDSDFVSLLYCDSLPMGGVRVTSFMIWNNTTLVPITVGYIQIEFPEDMDISGTAPVATVYNGTFGGTLPATPVTTGTAGSGWYSGRIYRCYVSVPPGDFTHGASGMGSYYNVSVAGCRDASGNVIQTYGTDGTLASTNVDKANATDHIPGSASVIKFFQLCE